VCALVGLPCVGTVYTVCGPLQTTTTSMNISLSFALQSAGTTKYALGEEACAVDYKGPSLHNKVCCPTTYMLM